MSTGGFIVRAIVYPVIILILTIVALFTGHTAWILLVKFTGIKVALVIVSFCIGLACTKWDYDTALRNKEFVRPREESNDN